MYKLLKTSAITAFLALPYLIASAAPGDPTGDPRSDCNTNDGKICNPLEGSSNLLEFLEKVLDIVIKIGAIIALLAIIYAGFLFVTAGGSDEKIKTAKKTILYTVIGTAIILGAKVILEVVRGTIESLT